MITPKYDKEQVTLYGLSTDEKPTYRISNGTAFVEMDTHKIYFFDAANATWREQ